MSRAARTFFYGPHPRDGWCPRARERPAHHEFVDGVQVRDGAYRRAARIVFPRTEFAVVFALIWGRTCRGWKLRRCRIADRLATAARRGVGDVKENRWPGLSRISRHARLLRNRRDDEQSGNALAGAGCDPRHIELPARAVLASRHRRFHDGHHQRAHLLGVRSLALLSCQTRRSPSPREVPCRASSSVTPHAVRTDVGIESVRRIPRRRCSVPISSC